MIVQISIVRNELALIKALIPVWKKYADGFVFMLDSCDDGTLEYLNEVKDDCNILEILTVGGTEHIGLRVETDFRSRLFETARKYSEHIICLDADEYLEGEYTKEDLGEILSANPDTLFHLQWQQYTSCNTVRVDGPWRNNYKDRIGCYTENCAFEKKQNHSTHLPIPKKQLSVDPNKLFIAHLQWLDKKHVAIKQYYWKIYDYVNNLLYGVDTVGSKAYDESVNNFEWEEEYTDIPLKISPYVVAKTATERNYRLDYIQEKTKEHAIPNLGSWGYDFMAMSNDGTAKTNPYKMSVITAIGPLEKYSEYVVRYLENVLDQHMFLETEHIIVYSEWSDLFEKFKAYPNFKLIQEDKKAGMYYAWNMGIKAATTDYVTNWNIDDLRHPINTKIKYDLLEKNDYDVAYNYYVSTLNQEETFYNLDLSSKSFLMFPDNYENHYTAACLIGPDPVWRKSLHEKAGYFDFDSYSVIGDWEMWSRFAKSGAKFKLIPEILCIYLDHPNTVSRNSESKLEEQKVRLARVFEKDAASKSCTLVLAVYKEDLSWLDQINNPDVEIVLINKGIHTSHPRAKCVTIENIGVCDNSFAYYISTNYDKLSDFTIFSQGHPFDHFENMIDFINNKEYLKGYRPLADKTIYIPRGEGTTIFIENMLDYNFQGIHFPAGAQYCVSKNQIKSKPKSFWDDIYNTLPWKEDSFVAYFMERTWALLYDTNVKIKEGYRDSAYFTLKKKGE